MPEEYSAEDIQVIDLCSMDIVELLRNIEQRPMLLPERNIQSLDAFLNGWFVGRGYDADNGLMSRFSKYVDEQFENTSTHGWARMIAHYSHDSNDSLNRFFKMFDEFLKLDEEL